MISPVSPQLMRRMRPIVLKALIHAVGVGVLALAVSAVGS